MRRSYAILVAVLISVSSFAQAPTKMSYQAVIRNSSDQLLPNHAVGMRISILQGSATGNEIYKEIYNPNPQTNVNGLVKIEIGSGIPLKGMFAAINWADGPYFIKTETDPTGGTNYKITGTSELISVPYALFAKTAENLAGKITETDPIFNASPANKLFSSDISNWNQAFGWGDHKDRYRPIGYVPAWSDVTGKPSFAAVATSGNYNDLINKPASFDYTWTSITGKPTTISGYGITDAFNGTWVSLSGKPVFANVAASGSFNDLTQRPTTLAGYGITNALSTSHPANGITAANITNWNTAYSWGSHIGLYRPIGYVPAWSDVTGKPSFAAVATSGNYNDLSNKPAPLDYAWTSIIGKPTTISGYGITDAFNGTWVSLSGKPVFANVATSGSFNDLTQRPTTLAGYGITNALSTSHPANGITAANITNWNAAYSWGSHIGLYRPIGYVPAWSDVTGKPSFAAVATSGNYNDLSNKPAPLDYAWTSIIGKPTTISGYGITDAFNGTWVSLSGKPVFANVATSGSFNDLTERPTTLAGYGITNALSTSHVANGITLTNITNWDSKLSSYTETDPIFSVWNKSSGISITASQVGDFATSVTNNPAMLANTAKVSYPSADAAKLASITGTNTGDETTASIKTKLAITTLSGSNTGDNAVNSLYSGLVTNANHTGDVTGSGSLTIANKVTMTGTAPVLISGSPIVIASSAVAISIAQATASLPGSMSAADKTKLDGITDGAEVNVNSDWNASSGDALILNKPTTLAGYGITDAVKSVTDKTAGDMLYYDGTNWTRIPKGISGQVLTMNASSQPVWKDLNAGTPGLPGASTQSASVYANNATLNGIAYASGSLTSVSFEYGLTTSYGNSITATQSPCSGYSNIVMDATISGLTIGETYHFRIKASNAYGTTYGEDMSFTASKIFDVDGNIYSTVQIGNQIWMAENLKTLRYRNGDLIGTTIPASKDITSESMPNYQWAYDGTESNVATYGRLYNWFAVTDTRNLCPNGWHIPSDAEWTVLTDYLGGDAVAGDKLKEAGLAHWAILNEGANNETGFTALPGGYRNATGSFHYLGVVGYWWSSTESEYDALGAWHRELHYYYGGVGWNTHDKRSGFSVRCLRD